MKTVVDIKGFQGKYRFLSNFYPCPITFNQLIFQSSEAAYQSAKTTDSSIKEKFTQLDARAARRLGKSVVIREDWESEKPNVMYHILREKFSKDPLRGMLLSTGNSHLEETNYWHDTFWGVYNGKGLNHLGRLLMLVRDELRLIKKVML